MKKIKSIEGIRTIVWVGIFVCHYIGAFIPDRSWILNKKAISFICTGHGYLEVLFIVSGFVLSYKFFSKECYELIPRDMVKRYFRLMPPVLFCELAVYVMMRLGLYKNAEVAELVGTMPTLGAFNQFRPDLIGCLKESLVVAYIRATNQYIGPLWTLRYEYIGALMILAALFVFRKTPWRWLFYSAFLILLSTYFNYLVLGMLLCDLYVNTRVSRILEENAVIRIIAIVSGYILQSMAEPRDGDKVSRIIFAVGITVFLLGVLTSKRLEKVLGNRIMLEGGKLGFSAYIVHWPVIETLSCGLVLLLYGGSIPYNYMIALIFIPTLLAVLIISKLISMYIEPIGLRITRIIDRKWEKLVKK
ncbi:MAG: acyltransferase [Butyrivibrio sp.]|nr:acyltransferase [Butyrivibrio sp.]